MLSENIRNYRKANNLSQDELAEKLDVSRQSISLWETGQTQPSIENIVALSKIFGITTDLLLDNSDGAPSPEPAAAGERTEKTAAPKAKSGVGVVIPIALLALGLLVAAAIGLISLLQKNGAPPALDTAAAAITETEKTPETDAPAETTAATTAAAPAPAETTAATAKPAPAPAESKATAAAPKPATAPAQTPAAAPFDLFEYCKDFAIQIGKVNGDHCSYQQPSTRYGGYADEYFSLSYWGDSNMVEFCLHCPLSDTQSVNFYLRMRGGYNGTYEYATSKYNRETGVGFRDAFGTIDPAVFSTSYPLNCDRYYGAAEGQNEFMEESRVGLCDLIACLKGFVRVENMDCGFSAFEFVNF